MLTTTVAPNRQAERFGPTLTAGRAGDHRHLSDRSVVFVVRGERLDSVNFTYEYL